MSGVAGAKENEAPQASAAGNREKSDRTDEREETTELHVPGVSQAMLDEDIESVGSDGTMEDVGDTPMDVGKESSYCQEKLASEKDAEMERLKRQLLEKEKELEQLRQAQRPRESPVKEERPRMPEWWKKACSMAGLDCKQVPLVDTNVEDPEDRSEKEFDVQDEMHFLHGKFRCMGQPFPVMPDHPGLTPDVGTRCRCSTSIKAMDLIPSLPAPACEHRVENVLEAARIFAIWNGSGTLAEKIRWIQDPFHRRITARSVALAYSFFKTRCLHVSFFATTIPANAVMRHAQVCGWPYDLTEMFEIGWRLSGKANWKDIKDSWQSEHQKVILIIPEILRRLKFVSSKLKMVDIFYYKEFSEVHLRRNELFRDEMGHVIYVLPPEEPKRASMLLPFVSALNMWLRCGSRVYLLPGPMPTDLATWYRVMEQARKHVHGYLEERMELAGQVVDKLPSGPGVIDPSSPCFAVGQIPDVTKWLYEDRARLFYDVMRNQLWPHVQLEILPPSNYVRHRPCGRAGKPPREDAQSGISIASVKGGINKNKLKRKQKRWIRSAARATERALQSLDLSSSGANSSEGGGMLGREQ